VLDLAPFQGPQLDISDRNTSVHITKGYMWERIEASSCQGRPTMPAALLYSLWHCIWWSYRAASTTGSNPHTRISIPTRQQPAAQTICPPSLWRILTQIHYEILGRVGANFKLRRVINRNKQNELDSTCFSTVWHARQRFLFLLIPLGILGDSSNISRDTCPSSKYPFTGRFFRAQS
jgi:hypothetical protein